MTSEEGKKVEHRDEREEGLKENVKHEGGSHISHRFNQAVFAAFPVVMLLFTLLVVTSSVRAFMPIFLGAVVAFMACAMYLAAKIVAH